MKYLYTIKVQLSQDEVDEIQDQINQNNANVTVERIVDRLTSLYHANFSDDVDWIIEDELMEQGE
jgi:hypothetical protein